MQLEFIILIISLLILAQVAYLVVKLPRQNFQRKAARPILIDTSVLIDGRILAVVRSGFVTDQLVIPRSVIGELQFLADNGDHDKRSRARHGLDVVSELQQMPEVEVKILQDGSKAEEGVDERLLILAKKHQAAICTIDFNLNKVAVVENIVVLNVNELAQNLRMMYLPGEKMVLELVQKGQDSHQAVGYLSDGTMVVVERASKYIGGSREVEFIRSLQTAAGKMMFAKLVVEASDNGAKASSSSTKASNNSNSGSNSKTSSKPSKKPAGRQVVKKVASTNKKPDSNKPAPNRGRNNSSKRPPTIADREASLMDLVDKQS